MNIKIKKFTAGLTAIMIAAASMGVATADAYGIIYAPNSKFEYELSARIVSDTQIELKIDVTNNPGFYQVAFNIHYENCNVNSHNELVVNKTNFKPIITNNTEKNNLFLSYWRLGDLANNFLDTTDYTGDFSVGTYFTVDNAYETNCKFYVSVVAYSSNAEKIYIDKAGIDNPAYEPPVEISYSGLSYRIGDMNNNGKIEISDVSDVNHIIALSGDQRTISVADLNNHLSDGAWLPFDWRAEFPNLVCAEVADANKDHIINMDDSNEIMTYYSSQGANVPFETYVNTTDTKTILVLV